MNIEKYLITCEQQFVELQELNNRQQLLTVELSDKLEKTEVKKVHKRWLNLTDFSLFQASDLVQELNLLVAYAISEKS